jgi:hypothetical protein
LGRGTSAVWRRRMWNIGAHLVCGAAVLLGSSCIVGEGDERCDAHQVNVDNGKTMTCLCEPDTIPDPRGYGCKPCDENEEVENNQCVCKPGYAKPTPDAACEPSEGQVIGADCSGAEACTEPYPYCATDGTERFCTKQDCDPGDCPPGYSCDSSQSPSFCAKLPSGLGVPCTPGGNECAAFEANYCESFMAHTCFVQGCATGQLTCPGEYGCCDLSGLAGMALSLCIEPALLSGGTCPVGVLVMP